VSREEREVGEGKIFPPSLPSHSSRDIFERVLLLHRARQWLVSTDGNDYIVSTQKICLHRSRRNRSKQFDTATSLRRRKAAGGGRSPA